MYTLKMPSALCYLSLPAKLAVCSGRVLLELRTHIRFLDYKCIFKTVNITASHFALALPDVLCKSYLLNKELRGNKACKCVNDVIFLKSR